MARTPKIAPQIRAAAIADLLAGEQPAVVAATYGLDPATVRQWKTRFVTSDSADVPARKPTLEAQHASIGATVLDLLQAKLKASQALAVAVSDPEWLKRQSAAELAALGQWLDGSAFAIGDRLALGAPARE